MEGNKKNIEVNSEIVFQPQAGSSASNDSLQWNFSEVIDDDVEVEYSYAAACSTPVTPEKDIDAEKLIEAVRNREALWDLSSSDYKNRMLRPNLWREVARETSYNELKVTNLRKRWDGIKSAYMRAKAGVPSGSCATGKEYKYARLLSFLDDTYEPRRTMSTMDSPSTSTDNSCNVPNFEVPHTPKRKTQYESMALKRRALEVIESRAIWSESAEDSFGNFIAQKLKSLTEPYRAELQLDIMRSLFNIKKKYTIYKFLFSILYFRYLPGQGSFRHKIINKTCSGILRTDSRVVDIWFKTSQCRFFLSPTSRNNASI